MKKPFLLGVLAGCVLSALIFAGYYAVTKRFSRKTIVSTEVQQQIIQNIQDTEKLLAFADDILAEYADTLMEVREILVKTDAGTYINQEEKKKIAGLCEKGLEIIETAMFNTIPVFLTNSDGECRRAIPVTLDAAQPTYKLTISCAGFDRKAVNSFITNLTPETGLKNNIAELDKIISAVSLERAQAGAYQNRLTHSLETAEALSKSNLNERRTAINRIIQKIKTEQLVLSVRSANGIYCPEDRQQIQLNYDELNKELNRISVLSQKPTAKNNAVSLLSQSDAENAMLYLAKKQ
jgi:flagellin-like hook-associated protein FlgL